MHLIFSRDRKTVEELMKRFPNIDLKLLQERYPDLDIEKISKSEDARGSYP